MKKTITVAYLLVCGVLGWGIMSGRFGVSTVSGSQPQVLAAQTTGRSSHPLVSAINDARLRYGQQPLVENLELSGSALDRARDMVNREYYAHLTPEGTTYIAALSTEQASGYSCENLDMLYEEDMAVAVNDWLGSDAGHRKCLLHSNVRSVGVAIVPYGEVSTSGGTKMAYIVVAIQTEL